MSAHTLLERDTEVAALRDAVAATAAGRGATVLIEGPAGIGKTALLDTVGLAAADHGSLVLGARASELDRGFAFGVVHQLLEPHLRAAGPDGRARLFTGAAARAEALFGGPEAEGDPGYGVLSGLYWLLANIAEETALVLRVDDLHWTDVPSLRALEFLARRLDDLPVLVVGTLRTAEPGAPEELLAELRAAPATRTLAPAPLGEEAIARLLTGTIGAPPDTGFRDAAARSTGGNPLLLTVLAHEASAHGLHGLAAEGDALLEIGGRGVAPTVARRLRSLGDDALAVVRAVAVVGERALAEDVAALAGRDAATVRAAAAALADAEILAPGAWSFVHPLVGAAVLEGTPRAECMALHREAAVRLRQRGARPAEIAVHRLAAEPAGDPDAVEDLRAAARAAAAEGATETAVDLMRRALAEPPPAAERARVLLALGELEMRAQAPEGIARLREALAAGLDVEDEVRARAALGTVLVHTDPAAALSEVDQAYEVATDPGLRLRLEAFVMEALIFVEAFGPQRDARFAEGRAAADPSPVMLAHLAVQEACAGRPAAEVRELARRAMADGAIVEHVGPGSSTWNLLTHATRFAEDAETTRALLTDAERMVRERGLRFASFFVDQSWGYWHRDFGSVAAGAARARLGYDQTVEAGLVVTAPALAAITAENLALLDRLEEAAELIDVPLGPAQDTYIEPFALSSRGLVRSWRGRADDAEADLRRVIAIADGRGWRAPLATRGRLRLAELLARQGRGEEARELMDHDIAVAREAGTPGALGTCVRIRALALDDDAPRIAPLREAVEILAPGPMRLEHGRALHDLGAALRRTGERREARDVLRAALDIAARTESAWLARRVRDELTAAGGRPQRERISGVEALTPSERRIAELAAEGRTNREIAEALWVTRKTVEYHLGHAYSKLEISSRAQLAGALGQPAPV